MAASKWHSITIPFFALLIIITHVSSISDRQDDHKVPPSPPAGGLSARLDETPTAAYTWQYWQWAWGTPPPTFFPWGSASLYCTPVTCNYGTDCDSILLEFDYDRIGFSYNSNYYRRNEASMKENNKPMSLRGNYKDDQNSKNVKRSVSGSN